MYEKSGIDVQCDQADIDTNRLQMAQFMNCGTDDERSDFFAFNDYSWCDPSSFTTSGWDKKVENFTGYGLPLFLSEYGCNTNKRQFQEVSSLYSTDMTGVYSGGLVYEYSQEPSKYGLVEINDNKVKTLADYDALKSAFEKTSNPKGDGGYNKTGGANPCPAKDSPNWDVDSDDLPAIPEGAKKFMKDGAGKGEGFAGKGSMSGGGSTSTGTAEPGSGSATGSSGSSSGTSSSSAAGVLNIPNMSLAPLVVGMVTVMSTFVGAGIVLV